MRILWIVNTIFPDPSESLGMAPPVFGGWMYGLADQISKSQGIELAVATTYRGMELKKMALNGIIYFLLPTKNNKKYDKRLEAIWESVYVDFTPHIIHIHGSEYTHGLACIRRLPNVKYVVSIQGLVGVAANYFFAGISIIEILRNITFRDVLKGDTLIQARKSFEKRGKFEREYIERVIHVIGRTRWDYVHTKSINANVNYHFCNESLRDVFYSCEKWSPSNCVPHSIFLSQGGYPIKGLHQLLKAVSVLKMEYADLKIKIGGDNLLKRQSILERIKRSGYAKYLNKLIIKYGLQNDIVFLGTLSAEQMIKEYQSANVFVCPSSIENSSNSIGEAQLLGVPTVASYVGGVPDMIEDGQTGLLYRFEEIEMLVDNIRRIFEDDILTSRLSKNGIEAAALRHDKDINLKRTMAVYCAING